MNTDNNQRYKDTEDKIVNAYGKLAFEKAIDKITVSDICKEAKIHRTTFYGHFEDIIELQTYVETTSFRLLIDAFQSQEGWSLRDCILTQLNFFCEYQSLMKRNFQNPAINEHLVKVLKNNFSSSFEESYRNTFKIDDNIKLKYHHSFVTAGAVEVIKKWILSGCKESPAEMTDILCSLLVD